MTNYFIRIRYRNNYADTSRLRGLLNTSNHTFVCSTYAEFNNCVNDLIDNGYTVVRTWSAPTI